MDAKFVRSRNGFECLGLRESSHLISSVVGAEVADDDDQVSYHSFHFLVVAIDRQLWTAVVQQDCHHVEELERQALLADNFLLIEIRNSL
jgi:hypothetical protein